MDHGDHDMPMAQCKLHMLWNTQVVDTCVVFRSWHISSRTGMLLSCLAIVALCVFHEWVRLYQRRVDYQIAQRLHSKAVPSASLPSSRGGSGRASPSRADAGVEEEGLLGSRLAASRNALTSAVVPCSARLFRAALYGASVFISFFLMLVFMTYNAYLITAVVVGAAAGHYIFGGIMNTEAVLNLRSDDAKGMACH